MAGSVADYLERDMECEELLECLHGLKELDHECFLLLVDSEDPLTVDDIAEGVDRERSTAYRAVQRLVSAGVVQKEQVNYQHGGYYHVFYPTDPDELADEMQRLLNDWYAQMGQLIHEFREKYRRRTEEAAAAE